MGDFFIHYNNRYNDKERFALLVGSLLRAKGFLKILVYS